MRCQSGYTPFDGGWWNRKTAVLPHNLQVVQPMACAQILIRDQTKDVIMILGPLAPEGTLLPGFFFVDLSSWFALENNAVGLTDYKEVWCVNMRRAILGFACNEEWLGLVGDDERIVLQKVHEIALNR
jgi:hypothetical protein